MGRPKQLLDVAGEPMVRRAAMAALASGCRPVVAVVGAHAEAVRQALAALPVVCVTNDAWQEGIGSSIACGVRALADEDVCGVVLGLADQPLVTASMLEAIALRVGRGASVVASRYGGTLGVPAGFGRPVFEALLALRGHHGARTIIQARLAGADLLDCPAASLDVDVPGDYAALVGGGLPGAAEPRGAAALPGGVTRAGAS